MHSTSDIWGEVATLHLTPPFTFTPCLHVLTGSIGTIWRLHMHFLASLSMRKLMEKGFPHWTLQDPATTWWRIIDKIIWGCHGASWPSSQVSHKPLPIATISIQDAKIQVTSAAVSAKDRMTWQDCQQFRGNLNLYRPFPSTNRSWTIQLILLKHAVGCSSLYVLSQMGAAEMILGIRKQQQQSFNLHIYL